MSIERENRGRDVKKFTNLRYVRLTSAEDCLLNFGELKKSSNSPLQTYFQKRSTSSFIEDDHIPFLKRSESCLP